MFQLEWNAVEMYLETTPNILHIYSGIRIRDILVNVHTHKDYTTVGAREGISIPQKPILPRAGGLQDKIVLKCLVVLRVTPRNPRYSQFHLCHFTTGILINFVETLQCRQYIEFCTDTISLCLLVWNLKNLSFKSNVENFDTKNFLSSFFLDQSFLSDTEDRKWAATQPNHSTVCNIITGSHTPRVTTNRKAIQVIKHTSHNCRAQSWCPETSLFHSM